MFTSVDLIFTTANSTLALGNLEFMFEDILGPSMGVIHPVGDKKVGLLHNLLDDSKSVDHLGDSRGDTDGARQGLNNAARSTKNFSLTTDDLCLTLSNIAFALGEGLRPFGSDVSPDTFIYGRFGIWNGWGSCRSRRGRSVLRG